MMKKYSRNIFALHSWTGIIAGLGILLLSLSGSVLLFHHEIDHAFYEPELPARPSTTTAQAVALDQALAEVRSTYPNWNVRIMLLPDQQQRPLVFDLRRPGKKLHVYTDPATGKILKEQPEHSSITMVALKLHYSMLAGLSGRIAVMALGILFLISLLTGLYIYRKKIWDILCFRWKIRSRSGRKKLAFWHNLTGTWAILFNLMLAVTGLYLSYLVVANGFRISSQTLPDPPETPGLSLNEKVVEIRNTYPNFVPSYIRLPVDTASSLIVYGSMKDDFALYDEYANTVSVDPQTASVGGLALMRDRPFSDRLAAVMKPLHAGEFGGIAVRLIYMLLGLSVPLLSVTGYIIVWRRKGK